MQLPFVLPVGGDHEGGGGLPEPFMEKLQGMERASWCSRRSRATHDIGKNLVDIILSNNGYSVVNLGIKQPVDAIWGHRAPQGRRHRHVGAPGQIDGGDEREPGAYGQPRAVDPR